jgi:hypothetical protein
MKKKMKNHRLGAMIFNHTSIHELLEYIHSSYPGETKSRLDDSPGIVA